MAQQFASDKQRLGICPEALEAMPRADAGRACCRDGRRLDSQGRPGCAELFETDCEIFCL